MTETDVDQTTIDRHLRLKTLASCVDDRAKSAVAAVGGVC